MTTGGGKNSDPEIDELIINVSQIRSNDSDEEEYSETLDRSVEWEKNQADQGFEEIFTESTSSYFEGFLK